MPPYTAVSLRHWPRPTTLNPRRRATLSRHPASVRVPPHLRRLTTFFTPPAYILYVTPFLHPVSVAAGATPQHRPFAYGSLPSHVAPSLLTQRLLCSRTSLCTLHVRYACHVLLVLYHVLYIPNTVLPLYLSTLHVINTSFTEQG